VAGWPVEEQFFAVAEATVSWTCNFVHPFDSLGRDQDDSRLVDLDRKDNTSRKKKRIELN